MRLRDIHELDCIKNIAAIPLNNLTKKYFIEKSIKIDLDTCLGWNHRFLNDLNSNLSQRFLKIIDEGRLVLYKKHFFIQNIGEYQIDTKEIHMTLTKNFEDIGTLLHESIHEFTVNEDSLEDPLFNFFRETPTIASEFILEDYLLKEKFNIPGLYNLGNLNNFYMQNNAITIMIKLKLLEYFLARGSFDAKEFIGLFPKANFYDVKNVLKEVKFDGELGLMYEFPYILGTLISFDTLNNMQKLDDSISIFKKGDLSPLIDEYKLDFDIKNDQIIIPDNTIKRLEKSYQKTMQKRG